jgi:hypothetical protein
MSEHSQPLVSKIIALCLLAGLAACQAGPFQAAPAVYRRLPVREYRQKMMAGWLGQMVGVSFGAPTEFRYRGQMIPQAQVPTIRVGIANNAFGQDDLYVEMTFLRTLETYGLEVSPSQAGLDFAASEYALWHANSAGRLNLRAGTAPPDSGHPYYNPHADDIDYQIESDFAGLISPGLPNQAIALGETFGRLMNYGDGLYGGQFVSCMYAEAFFESSPEKLVQAGLACIPEKSQYAEAVSDVLIWWRENPQDWQATWQKIEEKYQQNLEFRRSSCSDIFFDETFNIDAKINGAYVVMGMLYGNGDPLASMTITMRGGQDSDCNPATAGGVLFTTLGWNNLPADFRIGLNRKRKWDYTDTDFDRLVEVCEKLARQAVVKAGGRIEQDASGEEVFVIPVRSPRPARLVQSWKPDPPENNVYSADELSALQADSSRLARELGEFAPGWRVTSCAEDFLLGLKHDIDGRSQVLLTRSGDWMPCTLANRVTLPGKQSPVLRLEAGRFNQGEWLLVVRAAGEELLRQPVDRQTAPDNWLQVAVDLEKFRGETVWLEVSNHPSGPEGAYGWISALSIGDISP